MTHPESRCNGAWPFGGQSLPRFPGMLDNVWNDYLTDVPMTSSGAVCHRRYHIKVSRKIVRYKASSLPGRSCPHGRQPGHCKPGQTLSWCLFEVTVKTNPRTRDSEFLGRSSESHSRVSVTTSSGLASLTNLYPRYGPTPKCQRSQ